MADSIWNSISSGSSSLPSSKGSLSRAASTHSHQLNRNFVKLAVDASGLMGGFRKGKIEDVPVRKGVRSDQIKADIQDDELYQALCDDPELTLLTINYCQRAVSDQHRQQLLSLPKEKLKEKLKTDSGSMTDLAESTVDDAKEMLKRSVINHDYLVLELRPGANAEHGIKIFYIHAEKVARGGKRGVAGIYISYRTAEEAEGFLLHDKTKLLAVECETKMPLQTIVEVLKAGNPDYSLRDANCWDYAVATTKHLIKEAAGGTGTSATVKDRLMEEYNSLESKLTTNNIVNMFVTLKDAFLKGSESSSI